MPFRHSDIRLSVLLITLIAFVGDHRNVRAQFNTTDVDNTSTQTESTVKFQNDTTTELSHSSTDGSALDNATVNSNCHGYSADGTNSTCNETSTIKKSTKSVKTDYVGFVAIPLFLALGLFGNTMTIIVMSSKRFRTATCSLILIFLSCSDTVLILMQPWNKPWIISMLGIDIRALSEIGCKLFFIFRRTAKMSSSWLVVFVCFERFVAVCLPLHTKLICTKRNTIIGIVSVYAVMFSYTGAWSIFSRITQTGKCVPYFVEAGSIALGRAFMIVGTSLYAVIPTILLLIMTPIIVHRLVKQRNRRKAMIQTMAIKNDETFRITIMLLGITTAYVILVSPIWLGHNVAFARGETLFQSKDPVLVIFRQVAQPMEQLNYSINFFLYVLCSKSFREHVAKLLGCERLTKKKEDSSRTTAKTPASRNESSTPTNESLGAQQQQLPGNNRYFQNGDQKHDVLPEPETTSVTPSAEANLV